MTGIAIEFMGVEIEVEYEYECGRSAAGKEEHAYVQEVRIAGCKTDFIGMLPQETLDKIEEKILETI